MAYEWIGAAAAAGASAIGAFAGQHPSKARRYAREMAQFNNELAVQNWQRQNEYDLPVNQMQRYQEAGLNPNLIYGQMQSSGSIQSGSASFDADSMVPHEGKALQGIAGAIGLYQQIRSQQIQNSNANLVGELTSEQIRSKQIANDVAASVAPYTIENTALSVVDNRFKTTYKNWTELNYTIAKLNTEITRNRKMGVDVTKSEEELEVLKDRAALYKKQLEGLTKQIGYSEELFPYQLEAAKVMPGYYRAQGLNAAAHAALAGSQKTAVDISNEWLPTLKSDEHQKNIWTGPDVWKIPGAFLKQLDAYLKSLGLDF